MTPTRHHCLQAATALAAATRGPASETHRKFSSGDCQLQCSMTARHVVDLAVPANALQLQRDGCAGVTQACVHVWCVGDGLQGVQAAPSWQRAPRRQRARCRQAWLTRPPPTQQPRTLTVTAPAPLGRFLARRASRCASAGQRQQRCSTRMHRAGRAAPRLGVTRAEPRRRALPHLLRCQELAALRVQAQQAQQIVVLLHALVELSGAALTRHQGCIPLSALSTQHLLRQ